MAGDFSSDFSSDFSTGEGGGGVTVELFESPASSFYGPARVYIHDGSGRRLAELVDAYGNRTYRTMQASRAIYSLPETDPLLKLCDPREDRILVIESTLYPWVWAGPLIHLGGRSQQGDIQLEARGYEGILQERYLPTGFTASGSAGAVFRALWQAVELENPAGVSISADIAAGQPFDDTSYGDRSLFESWNLVAKQTGHEWWLEHEVVAGVLVTVAQFRPARGKDSTADVALQVGPWGNVRVPNWRINTEGSAHRLRAVAGSTGATQAFSERARVERRSSNAAPVSQAQVMTVQSTRHGFDFAKWPTGQSTLSRSEALTILENVRGEGALAIAAEAVLTKGRSAQRAVELEVMGSPELWQHITPGDVITLRLPEPYLADGYDGPVAVISTQPMEHLGILHITVEVPDAS